MNKPMTYAGFYHDKHGVTMLARVVLDGWLFGFIPETEDCAGWQLGQGKNIKGITKEKVKPNFHGHKH